MLLKIGSTGDLVKKLQESLGIGADGTFGPGTESALKKWQAANGLEADGLAGAGTLAKMGISTDVPVVDSADSHPANFAALKGKVPDRILPIIQEAFPKYEITSNLRAAHFLAQIAHESGDFTIKTESMNYTTPARIVSIWPSRFNLDGSDGKKNANEYIKNESKLAEAVYGNRAELGNNQPGDGFRFRGGGYLQLTGREAYKGYAAYIGKSVEDTADLLRSDDHYAMDAACWEYALRMKLNPVADMGTYEDVVKKITKRVNGGYIGLEERLSNFKKFYAVL